MLDRAPWLGVASTSSVCVQYSACRYTALSPHGFVFVLEHIAVVISDAFIQQYYFSVPVHPFSSRASRALPPSLFFFRLSILEQHMDRVQ
jgi:hypothetical protein